METLTKTLKYNDFFDSTDNAANIDDVCIDDVSLSGENNVPAAKAKESCKSILKIEVFDYPVKSGSSSKIVYDNIFYRYKSLIGFYSDLFSISAIQSTTVDVILLDTNTTNALYIDIFYTLKENAGFNRLIEFFKALIAIIELLDEKCKIEYNFQRNHSDDYRYTINYESFDRSFSRKYLIMCLSIIHGRFDDYFKRFRLDDFIEYLHSSFYDIQMFFKLLRSKPLYFYVPLINKLNMNKRIPLKFDTIEQNGETIDEKFLPEDKKLIDIDISSLKDAESIAFDFSEFPVAYAMPSKNPVFFTFDDFAYNLEDYEKALKSDSIDYTSELIEGSNSLNLKFVWHKEPFYTEMNISDTNKPVIPAIAVEVSRINS